MPFIQNVSLSAVKNGTHVDPGVNSILIQIVDPDTEFPIPTHQFEQIYQFKFLDAEVKDPNPESDKVKEKDAKNLVTVLQYALRDGKNVIVHCHAGICRSGAVCEVGVMLGFEDTGIFRSPNLMVKHLMMKELGWLYDEQEQHSFNGYETASGVTVPAQQIEWETNNEKVFALAAARRERRQQTGE
jgi:rhodanese-related sulfurtransferase